MLEEGSSPSITRWKELSHSVPRAGLVINKAGGLQLGSFSAWLG
jgi:hypothetical protein